MRKKIKDILLDEATDYTTTIKGWVRSFRNNQFVAVNDGSCLANLQVVVNNKVVADEVMEKISAGAAVSVSGRIIPSMGKGQRVELKAESFEVLGLCDGEAYPLQLKNKPSLEFLREQAHL